MYKFVVVVVVTVYYKCCNVIKVDDLPVDVRGMLLDLDFAIEIVYSLLPSHSQCVCVCVCVAFNQHLTDTGHRIVFPFSHYTILLRKNGPYRMIMKFYDSIFLGAIKLDYRYFSIEKQSDLPPSVSYVIDIQYRNKLLSQNFNRDGEQTEFRIEYEYD